MRNTDLTRRDFLVQSAKAFGLVFSAGIVGVGCSKKEKNSGQKSDPDPGKPCENFTGLNETDLAMRKKLGYVKESPIPDNQCKNCNLYLPPKGDTVCGGCMLMKGPVYPAAYCTYWAPRV